MVKRSKRVRKRSVSVNGKGKGRRLIAYGAPKGRGVYGGSLGRGRSLRKKAPVALSNMRRRGRIYSDAEKSAALNSMRRFANANRQYNNRNGHFQNARAAPPAAAPPHPGLAPRLRPRHARPIPRKVPPRAEVAEFVAPRSDRKYQTYKYKSDNRKARRAHLQDEYAQYVGYSKGKPYDSAEVEFLAELNRLDGAIVKLERREDDTDKRDYTELLRIAELGGNLLRQKRFVQARLKAIRRGEQPARVDPYFHPLDKMSPFSPVKKNKMPVKASALTQSEEYEYRDAQHQRHQDLFEQLVADIDRGGGVPTVAQKLDLAAHRLAAKRYADEVSAREYVGFDAKEHAKNLLAGGGPVGKRNVRKPSYFNPEDETNEAVKGRQAKSRVAKAAAEKAREIAEHVATRVDSSKAVNQQAVETLVDGIAPNAGLFKYVRGVAGQAAQLAGEYADLGNTGDVSQELLGLGRAGMYLTKLAKDAVLPGHSARANVN